MNWLRLPHPTKVLFVNKAMLRKQTITLLISWVLSAIPFRNSKNANKRTVICSFVFIQSTKFVCSVQCSLFLFFAIVTYTMRRRGKMVSLGKRDNYNGYSIGVHFAENCIISINKVHRVCVRVCKPCTYLWEQFKICNRSSTADVQCNCGEDAIIRERKSAMFFSPFRYIYPSSLFLFSQINYIISHYSVGILTAHT